MLLPTVPSYELKLDCKNRFWIGLSKEKWFHVSPRGKGSYKHNVAKNGVYLSVIYLPYLYVFYEI